MTKRIFRTIFGVALVVLLAVFALVLSVMYNYSTQEQRREMRNHAAYISAGIEESGMPYLDAIYKPTNRITWIAKDGTVLFDSQADYKTMENHGDREEFILASQTGEGFSQRFSNTLSEMTMNYARILKDGSVIRVSTKTTSPLSLAFSMAIPLLLILISAVLFSFVLARKTAKRITKPINEINLEQPQQGDVYDELLPFLKRIELQNKQIQEQMKNLKRQKQEFDSITANMQEGLIVLDGEGDVLSYNQGVLQLLNISAPKELESVFKINRSEAFRESVETALGGTHWEVTLQIADRKCQMFANPVIQDGDVAGVILMIFDVTEREEREGMRREFTANVSHELKTPLTSISGFAEIMKNGMVRPADVPKFAGNIYDEAQRLIQLVQDIIKLSRLDEKQSTLEKTKLDFAYIVKDVVGRLEPIAQKKGIAMQVETENAEFFGVSQVINEMVYNLCDNAIKYNRENGKVEVSLKTVADEILLTVTDTGIGIAPANQGRVFERFYRVNESRSKETEGSGLGLSIVKHGALLHGAKVELKSALGVGTTIRVHFPLAQENEE